MMEKKNYARKYAKDFNMLTRLYQLYAIFCLFVPITSIFYNIKYFGKCNMQKDKRYILAPNHISYCDPFLVALATNTRNAFMAKKELYESSNYLAKNIFRLGAFAVNREKLEVSTIKSSKEAIKAGWNLCIFPQGGIKKNKKIEAVNKGFIVLAKMTQTNILPISIAGLESYNWKPFNRQKVEVRIGNSIPWEMEDYEIMQNWSEQIASMAGYEPYSEAEEVRELQKA